MQGNISLTHRFRIFVRFLLNSLCYIGNAIVVVFPKLAHTVLWFSSLLFLHTILHIFVGFYFRVENVFIIS